MILETKQCYKIIKEINSRKLKILKNSKESKRKYNPFWIISVTTLLGYLGKYAILIYFSNLKVKNDEKYVRNDNTTDYNNTNQTNITEFNAIFSNEKNNSQINELYTNIIYEYDRDLFLYICFISFISIFVSIILYWFYQSCIFKKKEVEKKTGESQNSCLECCCVHEISFGLFNCFFHIESFINSKNERKVGFCTQCGESIKYYFNEALCSIVNNEEYQTNCCQCCKNYNEDDYDKKIQFFCYCYKEEGLCSWITNFIVNETQKEIIPGTIFYFISKLMIIGSERLYEDFLKNNYSDIQKKKNFAISFLLVFPTFILFTHFIQHAKRRDEEKYFEDNKWADKFIKNSSEMVLEIYMIIFYNSMTSGFLAFHVLKGKTTNNKTIEDYLFFSILFDKFFIFSLNYFCVKIVKENTNEKKKQFIISININYNLSNNMWFYYLYYKFGNWRY